MNEEWKTITCLRYQEQMTTEYEASNLGNIRNKRTKHLVQPHRHNTGYAAFHYRYKGDDDKWHFSCMLWHRVIATTWIPNESNRPQIDHIDHNVDNNAVSNLRWVSAKENAENTRPKSKIKYSRYKPAKVVDKNGNVIAEYATLAEACEVYGVPIPHALEMLHGRRKAKKWGTFQQEGVAI